jgi:hypothetical protein
MDQGNLVSDLAGHTNQRLIFVLLAPLRRFAEHHRRAAVRVQVLLVEPWLPLVLPYFIAGVLKGERVDCSGRRIPEFHILQGRIKCARYLDVALCIAQINVVLAEISDPEPAAAQDTADRLEQVLLPALLGPTRAHTYGISISSV